MARSNTPLLVCLCALIGFLGSGCAAHTKPPAAAREAEARTGPEYPVIVRLVGRHYTVTASSGPAGVLWSARSADGRTVVANATLDELRTRHPEVYQQILPAVATQGDGANTRKRETTNDVQDDQPTLLGHVAEPAGGGIRGGELLLMDAAR